MAQSFAERVVGRIHAAFPACLILRLAGEKLLHFEVGVHEGLAQPGRGIIEEMPTDISLQRFQRLRINDAIHLLEEIGIADI